MSSSRSCLTNVPDPVVVAREIALQVSVDRFLGG
jgi:hypothetical protein